MADKLTIDAKLVDECRNAAEKIADGIQDHIDQNTTVSVERTILRLLGIDGVDSHEVPLPNVIVDQIHKQGRLGEGVAYWMGCGMAATGRNPQELALMVSSGEYELTSSQAMKPEAAMQILEPWITRGLSIIDDRRGERERLMQKIPTGPQPWLYVIVATGNIFEDVVQARAAAVQGADIIAVIRTTAQSLLDYVPYGPTTEGFGGTYATQENFRIMRKALDEVGEQTGRYIQLVNYCSGLCMPEIAAMGALERLDMMLNDAIYGILFRDINMKRTFVDQLFSRMINAYAGIIINTGEDNYLTTADAAEEGHTVLASQFINEELARRSGMPPCLMGLGHAFEMNPDLEDGFLFEVAQAQLVRQLFPDSPIKFMPPTKYMTGDIFRGHTMDGMFNMAGVLTGQSIQLLGMLTEAAHTPFLQDRALSIANAKYIFNNARHLGEELIFRPDGRIQQWADRVLKEAAEMLDDIAEKGLMRSIEDAVFASISRPADGGKGADGVIPRKNIYRNPFAERMMEVLKNED